MKEENDPPPPNTHRKKYILLVLGSPDDYKDGWRNLKFCAHMQGRGGGEGGNARECLNRVSFF